MGDSAVLAFARELRSLRERAGSPTDRRLSSMPHYSEAALSQAASGRKLPTLQVTLTGGPHVVKSVAFSPDGTLLATGGTDFAVRVWDAATGALSAELAGHTDTVHAVAFSPDVEHAAERICATVSPPLSAPGWNRHFPDVDLTPPCPR